jgi:hypothetical protein
LFFPLLWIEQNANFKYLNCKDLVKKNLKYFFQIEVKSIGLLDRAFCNKSQRIIFLKILDKMIISQYHDVYFYENTELYLNWVLQRNITLHNLSINKWNKNSLDFFRTNLFVNNIKALAFSLSDSKFRIRDGKELIGILKSLNLDLNEIRFVHNKTSRNFPTDLNLNEISKNCYANLKILDLWNCSSVTDDGLIPLLMHCKQLEDIDLTGNKITDESLLAISNNCLNIKILTLSHNYLIADKGVIAIAEKLTKLEYINLAGVKNITDLSLIEISKNCKKLKTFKLGNSKAFKGNITYVEMQAIAENLSNLVNIDLSGSPQLTNSSLIEISKKCQNLKMINLFDCRKIADKSIIEIVHNCLKLENINIGDMHRITDLSLIEISKYCSNLQTLNLHSSQRITDYGLISIAKKCLKLKNIQLENCYNITDVSLIEFSIHS